MWESPSDLTEYNTILTSVKAYAGSDVDKLAHLLQCKKAEFWLYRSILNAGPIKPFYVLVCVGETSARTGKVINLVPVGTYVPDFALGIGWTKVREIIDKRNITKFYGCPLVDYGDPNLNTFYSLIESRCWEVVGVQRDAGATIYTYQFERQRGRKKDDAKWP